jgi:hypothetical protein
MARWYRLLRQFDDSDLPRYAPYIFVVAILVGGWTHVIADPRAGGLAMLGWIGCWLLAPRAATLVAIATALFVMFRCLQSSASMAI